MGNTGSRGFDLPRMGCRCGFIGKEPLIEQALTIRRRGGKASGPLASVGAMALAEVVDNST